MIRILTAIVFVAAPLSVAQAQSIPRLNVDPSCQAAANGSLGLTQDLEACRQSEASARESIEKQWSQFTRADRQGCIGLVTMTGAEGTYTELLTCLEMKRDVRKLPKEPALGTVGQAPD